MTRLKERNKTSIFATFTLQTSLVYKWPKGRSVDAHMAYFLSLLPLVIAYETAACLVIFCSICPILPIVS